MNLLHTQNNNILTVTAINRYIKELVSKDFILSNLWIRGEISNFKHHSSGHMYFTLKDENSLLKCVMFRSCNSSLKFIPEDGMKVIIRGYISVFERDGQYQLYAQEMQNDGTGNLHIAFEQLKKKLFNEGLFDEKIKKRIPFLPQNIGVVTSSTGSVIRDIINVLDRRFYNTSVKIYPVRVQGEGAEKEISKGILRFNQLKCVDVIIIARGGGSLEELWPFNTEEVARSIFESSIPIISAVGHETDYTIADFVADVRAPTPSAAAELVIPERIAIENRIKELNLRLGNSLKGNLKLKRERLLKIQNSPALRQPYDRIYQERMKLDILNRDLRKAVLTKHERLKAKFSLLVGKLDTLSPLAVLSKGYGLLKSNEKRSFIKSIEDVDIGDEIEISLKDGKIISKVLSKE
ncbi:MAG TPA: exodeoxyribonuclease VII large subunit [Ruminiclostridium sp.]|jgi:exodeoxyribonuclease VII large subunit|uniref:Exodeoxyribonuclease 7 large subunit n=1 Tax=Acetivibrio saccincola TaxID=1677857 RepID=A0A2K9EM57_9FIRM|nr:exodeoxyribonuclease VII large subunit [Acetivibrio saccincola]HAA42837.1 exodeoxyribonuclease VII large subunit [Ruminiclostridium sp.]AUG57661.1 Exodeoxyribonuclease 7 large subunit [Acetivibrio saccincola]NLW26851.1 exodeoxyribonuclease VII large subunit [Acetivibrio saccincola]PQQ67557.1 exodeoxyribonuclease VII large subunit [Acetivibrio saccincola]HOA97634.1 exodeoxyribonuclease VII large subunit [Acetivibrio saccincola]